MFKCIFNISAMLSIVILLVACQGKKDITEESETTVQPTITKQTGLPKTLIDLDFIDLDFSSEDEDSEYDEDSAVRIDLNDAQTQITGSGAAYKDGVITISEAGEYVISGSLSDGQIVVSAAKNDVVQIILDNASVTNKSGSALYLKSAEKLVLTLAEGSSNEINDGEEYDDESDDAPDAAVYAAKDLTINGTGSLAVNGSYKNAIKCTGDLIIMSGNIAVTASQDGIRGKDSLIIAGGKITIAAGKSGLKSNNDKDERKGFAAITGGQINIDSGDVGIQAETAILFKAGTVDITSQKDAVNCNGSIEAAGGDITLSSGDDGIHANNTLVVSGASVNVIKSFEGLEGAIVSVTAGDVSIAASDDGINAAGGNDGDMDSMDMFAADSDYYVSISGGNVYINSGGDGIDSNGGIYISGGITTVSGPEESNNGGMDSSGEFIISGGTLVVTSSAGMLDLPSQASQPVLTVVFGGSKQTGGIFSISDDSETILAFSPVKLYECLMISSPDLELGKKYTFSYGGTYNGGSLNDVLYTCGSVSGSDELFTFAFNEYITTLDQNGDSANVAGGFSGMGGNMGGGKT